MVAIDEEYDETDLWILIWGDGVEGQVRMTFEDAEKMARRFGCMYLKNKKSGDIIPITSLYLEQ